MKEVEGKEKIRSKICFLGSFPPRECGIATFTKDLSSAMNRRFNPRLKSRIIALNEENSFYNYDDKVIMGINKDDVEDFVNIAKKINSSKDIKLVCIQHEFGLFGGEYGEYIIPFLETIEKPVVVTFHSVLPNPNITRKKVVGFICEKSSAIIVMAERAIDILEKYYGVKREKVHVVHHGIPSISFKDPVHFKKKLRLKNKIILSTFGLLSRGKGIEYVVKALPKLIKKYPNLIYLVVGETHPQVRKKEGENYRNELMEKVEKLGLKNHVKFYNKYLTLQEIINYLLASDIYICTNLEKNQIVSGTLSYALGCGKVVVSTPIAYSKEILADERGILVKFRNPGSFAEAIDKVLSDKELKTRIEKNAYGFSRVMTWSNVAARYLSIFNKVVRLREETTDKYPNIKLNHLKNLTDGFGVIQFSKLSVPDKSSGYTLDDNARALISAVMHHGLTKSPVSLSLSKHYLTFLEFAQGKNGKFKNNFMNQNEKIKSHSEDAFGRALWALGYTINRHMDKETIGRAERMFEKAYKLCGKLESRRAKSFAITGLCYYYKKYPGKDILKKIRKLADCLIEDYREESSENWKWFEHKLTYSNSKLSEALFLAYEITKDKKYLEVAEESLEFLFNTFFVEDKLYPAGQRGWFSKKGKRAFFDQQPIEASSLVQTCLNAYLITKKRYYYGKALLSFNWFLGNNHLNQMMYDDSTGGCYDGLSETSVNLNQGAESCISYLIARLFMEEIKRNKKRQSLNK